MLFQARWLLALLFFSSGICMAAQDMDSFLTAVKEKAASISTMEAEIHQTRHLSIFKQPVSFKGFMAMSRPDSIRWEYYSPVWSALLIQGSQGVKCEEGEITGRFDLAKDPVMSAVARQIRWWMGGDYKGATEEFELTLDPKNLTLEMTPLPGRGTTASIGKISIAFDSETLSPTQIKIIEGDRDFTTITFSKKIFNDPIPKDLFSSCRRPGGK